MDRKPSRKGGTRPCPKQRHPVPQGPPFKCQFATGSPQSQLKHSFLKVKHFKAVLPHHPHKSSPQFLCGRGGVTTHHCNHIRFKPSYGPVNHTGVQCLINRHGLTIDLLSCPQSHQAEVKGHTASRTRPPPLRPGPAPQYPSIGL